MNKLKAHIVIQTAFLGDLILSIPLFKRIKELNPEIALIVICKKGLGDFLLKEKIVDQAIEVTKGEKKTYKKALSRLHEFEVINVYCLHRSVRSLLFAAQIQAERKIGFSSFLGFWIFDDQVDFADEWPEVLRILKILETTDAEWQAKIADKSWEKLNQPDDQGFMPVVPERFSFSKKKRQNVSQKIALFPGSVWATKRWTPSGYTEVAKTFIALGYAVDLLGGPDEKELCQQIAVGAEGVRILAGDLSIAQSIAQVSEYDLVICNDSAATHMASYQKVPILTIFGPTTLDLGFRPWSNEAMVVQNNQLNCRPCGPHGHQKCPLGHHHCMQHIQPQQVIDSALKLLRNSNQRNLSR